VPNVNKRRLVELVREAAGQQPVQFCSISTDLLASLNAAQLRVIAAYFALAADSAALKTDVVKRIRAAVLQRSARA